MGTLLRIVAGVLLTAHGAVHLLFVAPDAARPGYPFSLDSSWLLPRGLCRQVGRVLMVAVVVAFATMTLALWGVPGLSSALPTIAIVAGGLSLAVLVAFWDTRLLFGVGVSLAVIALALARPRWLTAIGG